MTTLSPISRQQLAAINKRTLQYTLDIAEKDYFLGVALSLIAASPLKEKLVFKGGTAIHHCYLPQYRFSEDIDFSTLDQQGLTAETIKRVLEQGGLFQVRKQHVSHATIKIERLWYPGILDQPGAIKVEIDHMQQVVLPPVERTYANVWGIPLTVAVMDVREICAEKLRAASQRARYRDFYDLFLLFEAFAPSLDEIVALMRQKEVRSPIMMENLRESWRRARNEFSAGRDLVHYARTIPDDAIAAMVASIQFKPVLPDT